MWHPGFCHTISLEMANDAHMAIITAWIQPIFLYSFLIWMSFGLSISVWLPMIYICTSNFTFIWRTQQLLIYCCLFHSRTRSEHQCISFVAFKWFFQWRIPNEDNNHQNNNNKTATSIKCWACARNHHFSHTNDDSIEQFAE